MKIVAEIIIKDEEWNQLSKDMQVRYLEKLSFRLQHAADSVGYDLSILLFNTKPFMVTNEGNELEWEKKDNG